MVLLFKSNKSMRSSCTLKVHRNASFIDQTEENCTFVFHLWFKGILIGISHSMNRHFLQFQNLFFKHFTDITHIARPKWRSIRCLLSQSLARTHSFCLSHRFPVHGEIISQNNIKQTPNYRAIVKKYTISGNFCVFFFVFFFEFGLLIIPMKFEDEIKKKT